MVISFNTNETTMGAFFSYNIKTRVNPYSVCVSNWLLAVESYITCNMLCLKSSHHNYGVCATCANSDQRWPRFGLFACSTHRRWGISFPYVVIFILKLMQ
jgi:hypothetical protein